MDKIYRYSNLNWVIETQYNQLEDLKEFLNKTEGVPYKKGLSTSGNSNQYWFLGRGADYSKNKDFIKIGKSIAKTISEKIVEYELISKDAFLQPGNSWTVIGTKGGFHKVHDHGLQNSICTITYTQVPEIMNDEEGYVYFIMSNEIRPPTYNSIPKVIELKPELGKMIIFPSHMLHGVYPYPEGIRQSFNFDFNVLPLNNKVNTSYEYD